MGMPLVGKVPVIRSLSFMVQNKKLFKLTENQIEGKKSNVPVTMLSKAYKQLSTEQHRQTTEVY